LTDKAKKPKGLLTPRRYAARRRLFILTVVLAIAAVVLAAYGYKVLTTPAETIIGVVYPETGIRARFGEAIKRGVEMAVEDINREPGRARKIVCVFADDGSDPIFAEKAAMWLIKDKKAKVLIGSYSNLCTLAVADVAEKMKVPHISPISSAQEISTKGYTWVFRLNAPAAHYACTMLDFLQDRGRVRRIALLHENDNAGMGFADAVKKYAHDLDVDLVYTKGYSNRKGDFRAFLKEAMACGPQAFLVNAHIEDALQIMKEARALGLPPQNFAGLGSGFSLPDFLTQGSSAVENTFSTVQWNSHVNWPGADSFAERFRKLHGAYPDEHSAAPYAAVQVVAACCPGRQVLDRSGIYTALKQVDTESIFGPIRFEDFEQYTNQNTHPLLVQQIQKGKHVIVWPLGLKQAEPVF